MNTKIGNLSALVVVHNEENQLADCLQCLNFAGEIVVVLDKCTDGSKSIAQKFGAKIIEGSWHIEGDRRNTGITACSNEWIFEIDADERIAPDLAAEIQNTLQNPAADYYFIPVDNYIGGRLVRHGWGGSFGKSAYGGLFRKGVKIWGHERVHPSLTWTGRKGHLLQNRLTHFVDKDLSDTIRRLDRYAALRAQDWQEKIARGENVGNMATQIRRFFSRFIKCYIGRQGWREGGHGIVIAACAGLFPVLSYLKMHEKK